jgi:hypothetical protein
MVDRRTVSRIAIVGSLLLTLSGAGATGVAWADDTTSRTAAGRPLAVVSLGDSYISGNAGRWLGNSADSTGDRRGTDRAFVATPSGPVYDPTLVYGDTDNGCFRSDVAEITHVRFPGVTPINLACSGATTDSVLDQNDQLAEAARSHRVIAIVLSVGGNDIGFSSIVSSCVLAFLGPEPRTPCSISQQANVDTRLPGMRAGLGRAIDDIRATMTDAGYRAGSYRLIVQSYPAPLPAVAGMRYPESGQDRVSIGGCPFLDFDVDWGRTSLVGQLNTAVRTVAAERGAQFLELRDALRGHELCSAAARQPETAPAAATSEWMRWIDLAGQGSVLESLHPNAYGQQALGRCLRLTLLFSFGADVSCHGVPGRSPASVYLRPLR